MFYQKKTGGCFAVQQTDVPPHQNTAHNVAALKTLQDVMSQIAHNQKDLPAAMQAVVNAGSSEAEQALAAANALLHGLPNVNPQLGPLPQASPQQTSPQVGFRRARRGRFGGLREP